MHTKHVVSSLVVLSFLVCAASAHAGLYNPKKVRKWPAEDQVWARALDAWMSDEELDVFMKIDTTEERKDFLVKAGHWRTWERVEDEMLPNIIKGEVVKGMNKDEVFMCWGKPRKIRKDFREDAYVDVLNYEFEIDRKGNEFLSRPDSKTAYKNEIVTKYVYMYDGRVFSIVYAGEEENVMDELPVDDPKTTSSKKKRVDDGDKEESDADAPAPDGEKASEEESAPAPK